MKLEPLSKSEAINQGVEFYFDPNRAMHVIEFFETHLRHSKGRFAGQPFTLLDWQKEMLAELFGWVRVADGFRRYRVAYVSTAKKSGKSTLLAGIGLYLLIADGEPGAEIFGCGTDRQQASIIMREMSSMVRASPLLSKELEVVDSRKTIAYKAESSFYRVLSADAFRVEGLNIHGLLFDELHAQRDRRLWDALRYGGAARNQPMLIAITTAGYDKNSVCYEQYSYAKNVLQDWKFDPSFFACIYEMDEKHDWTDEDAWEDANPSWNVTIKKDDFKQMFLEAQNSNTKENSFRRYCLNQWTAQENRWINMELWAEGGHGPPDKLEGRDCWCGLDLATTYDTSAFVAVFPAPDGTYDVLCRFWIPGDNAQERERRDKVPYVLWANQPESGLKMTEGNVTDYDVIRKDIVEFSQKYNVKQIGMDRWNATQLSIQLQGDGLDLVGYGQGVASMSAPSKHLENLIASNKLRHNSNPVLNWMASNVSVKTDASGNIRPVKPKVGSPERIDGMVSLVMAIGVQLAHRPEEETPDPGIMFL